MKRLHMAFIIAGCLVGLSVAIAFGVHASRLYSLTPSDPQKPVGYFFIALYSGIVGASVCGSVFTALLAVASVRRIRTASLCAMLSVLCAVAAVLLVAYSPK